MSYVRTVPASLIDGIKWAPGDYEEETSYHEMVGIDDPDYAEGGRTWYAAAALTAGLEVDEADDSGRFKPVMLHFAVNWPAGCVRGESDLASILPWLFGYALWLEDRVRLNAAVRAFLWIVKVAKSDIATRQVRVAHSARAGQCAGDRQGQRGMGGGGAAFARADAQADGRAIRWMVAAGGPGLALTDFGESETANLASASVMADQRTRFLKTRQSYFGYMLARLGLESYNRAVRLGRVRGKQVGLSDIRIGFSDVSTEDNGV